MDTKKQDPTQHPTVRAFGLRTYISRYADQRCCISGTAIDIGEPIANIVPILDQLQAFGMVKTKSFKYAAVAELPLAASPEEVAVLKDVAERMIAATDPDWPLDNVGCSRATYGPVAAWVASRYNPFGATRAARYLQMHLGTQIDKESAEGQTIVKVANRRWGGSNNGNSGGGGGGNGTNPTNAATPSTPTPERWPNGWLKQNPRDDRVVQILADNGKLYLRINQWRNKAHEAVYVAIKAMVGTRWDAAAKRWLVPTRDLALGNVENTLSIDRTKTEVYCDAAAYQMLDRAVETQVATVTTATILDTTVQVRDARKPGEVLIAANGSSGLKLYFDAPWVNPAHGLLKDKIKDLGAKWDGEAKCWRLGASVILAHWTTFSRLNLVVTPEAVAALTTAQSLGKMSSAVDASDDSVKQKINAALPDGQRLYPFQYAGVEFVDKAGGRVLISDEMGLGKSIETLAYLALHPEQRPAVLVVPAVVTGNWRREANAWIPKDQIQVLKTGKDEISPTATVLIVTYDLLKKHLTAIQARQPKVVVGDECHLVKNYKTGRAEAFIALAKTPSVVSMIGLSGTPIVNRPIEFYTFLSLLRPEEFASWKKYAIRYCDGKYEQVTRNKTVFVAKGATNTGELNRRLRSLMIRRTKDQVLKELPAKIRQITPVEMTVAEQRQYRTVAKTEHPNALAQITALRQEVGRIKVRAAIEWIEQYAETDTPLLVFAHHHDVLDALEQGCKNLNVTYGRIDGAVSQEQRTRLVDEFQAGKRNVMLLSTKAAGVGITLTRASNVLVVERSWTPGDEVQAEDRCHRIGQAQSVTIRYLTIEDTIDVDMAELIDSKRAVLAAVLDGTASADTDLDIRKELMERLAKKE